MQKQSVTVMQLLLVVHGWQAIRELKEEHKQKIKDLAFSEGCLYTVKTESACYQDLMEFLK